VRTTGQSNPIEGLNLSKAAESISFRRSEGEHGNYSLDQLIARRRGIWVHGQHCQQPH